MRLGAGIAPVRELLDARRTRRARRRRLRLERARRPFLEVKQALLVARARGGPDAMTAREALRLGTRGGAAVLGRDDIGSLEPGKRADVAVWRTDGLELGGADDPSPGSSSPARTASTGSTSAARRSSATAASCTPTRRRSRGTIGARRKDSLREHLDLHPRPRHRARRAGERRPRRALRGDELVAAGETDDDGRIAELAAELEPGVYRLVFHPPSPFFRRVELEVELGDGHYHVPLLVSPYSCATYRGS